MQRTQNFRPLSSTSFYNDANLVRYYTMDNLNEKGGVYNLTNANTCTQTTGTFSGAYSSVTSNTNKRLYNTTNIGINGGVCSISAWIKLNGSHTTSDHPMVVSEFSGSSNWVTNGIGFNQSNTAVVFSRLKSQVAWQDSSYTYSPGTTDWHHYVYTYDGTSIRGYVDGVLRAGPTAASGNGTTETRTAGVAIFGTDYLTNSNQASAQADDVAYFNRVLSDLEINQLYNQMTYDIGEIGGIQRTGTSATTMAYYPLTGGDAKEYSCGSIALDGTNQGAVTYSGKGGYFNGSTYVTVPDNGLLDTTVIRIQAEIIPTATNAGGFICAKGYEIGSGNNYSFYYSASSSTNGYIEFRTIGANGRSHKTAAGTVKQDVLTKIDVSCSNGDSAPVIYINGVSVALTATDTTNPSYTIAGNTNALGIGAASNGSGKFTGHIKHLRIRKRIPTAQEVRREYTNDKGYNII